VGRNTSTEYKTVGDNRPWEDGYRPYPKGSPSEEPIAEGGENLRQNPNPQPDLFDGAGTDDKS